MYDLILKNISRFITLTPEEEQYFISLFKVKKLRKKQYLLQEGEICRNEYFVTKGCLRTYTIDEKGLEHVIQFSIEDWWTGDMYSFLTQNPSSYTIDAIEDSELLYLDKVSHDELYLKVPKFERFFRHLLQYAFISMQERINATLSQTADQRYCSFIEKYPLMEQRLPLKQIASYLGITPESLSRIRSSYNKVNRSS
ncbi:MAG: Crp/Fnr family transcriptional regulator [Bacteroidetes bacterium]|nr:MAG: Crp/Fnr family transcriptional regulator [Bacteroidota bacterium]